MLIDLQTRQAYSEIDQFLNLLDEKHREDIPIKLREYFKKEKDPEYQKKINPKIPIKDQNLKSETFALIALLNLKYWCKDEQEKERLKKVYSNNERKYQEELRQKYNPDNIFIQKNYKENENTKNSDLPILVKKDNLFTNIIKTIKKIFFH